MACKPGLQTMLFSFEECVGGKVTAFQVSKQFKNGQFMGHEGLIRGLLDFELRVADALFPGGAG